MFVCFGTSGVSLQSLSASEEDSKPSALLAFGCQRLIGLGKEKSLHSWKAEKELHEWPLPNGRHLRPIWFRGDVLKCLLDLDETKFAKRSQAEHPL